MALSRRKNLYRLGEAHAVVLPIEGGVVLADEHVSQDPQRSSRRGDVQTHEAAQTHGLSGLSDLFDWTEEESETGGGGGLLTWGTNKLRLLQAVASETKLLLFGF